MDNTLYKSITQNTPFDVYAWKGNCAPYRFNLENFVPIITGHHDHLDPSVHCVLAVAGGDGANFVEFVAFCPRYNVTTDEYPTYLPPYDHRNNAKVEIMHYLGGYDARTGTLPGDHTIHNMGVNHGNDEETFKQARSGKNEVKYLSHTPATMLEITGYAKVNDAILSTADNKYFA